MKNILFYFLFSIFCTGISYSQDLITKKNGEDIKAKILEVGISEIKYKNFDNQDGPIYSLLKKEVLIIRYKNGNKDIFSDDQVIDEKSKINNINKNENKPLLVANEKLGNEIKPIQSKLTFDKSVSFGIKGGLNYANVTRGDTKNIIGYNIGGFLEYKFNKSFSIQPELQFSEQGYKYTYQLQTDYFGPAISGSKIVTLDYINVPILAKFNVSDEFNFILGPQIGFLATSKSSNSNKNIDIDIDFGVGLSVNNIIIDARYNLGLVEIYKYSSYKNSVFQLSFGYKF